MPGSASEITRMAVSVPDLPQNMNGVDALRPADSSLLRNMSQNSSMPIPQATVAYSTISPRFVITSSRYSSL